MTKSDINRWAARWRGWAPSDDDSNVWQMDGKSMPEVKLPDVCNNAGEAERLMEEMGVACEVQYLGKNIHPAFTATISTPHEDTIVTFEDSFAYALSLALFTYCERRK